jgi:hypothetical protein
MNDELGRILLNTMFKYTFDKQSIDTNRDNNIYEDDFIIDKRKNRIFTQKQKEQCWNKSKNIPFRDPNRWKYDALGNPVLKALKGCHGPLCHEYDHIVPYSKGGGTIVRNCQILQTTANKYKGNKIHMKDEKLKKNSKEVNISEYEMDLVEEFIYGNVNRVEML